MNKVALSLTLLVLVVAGCGSDDDSGSAAEPAASRESAATEKKKENKKGGEAMEKDGARMKAGTSIEIRDSQFGPVLFDSTGQAIYVFEADSKGKTVCYDDCAEAWPPVLTKGKPKAGKGADASLLGTVKRRDGAKQVTYAGRPLYFYAHEGKNEVKCHNVDLNGGLWWVVGADGEPLA